MHSSLPLADFLHGLRLRRIRLSEANGELRIEAPPGTLLPDDVASLRARKAEILASLRSHATIGDNIVAAIDRVAADRPDSIAIADASRTLSYAELGQRSDAVAGALAQHGATRETRIGLCLPRGVDRIVCLLGILKCGATYAALDDAWPVERLAQLARAGDIQLLIAAPAVLDAMTALDAPVAALTIDDLTSSGAPRLAAEILPNQLAYVVYTSGSTGTPKGVMIDHRALASLVAWHCGEYLVDASDVRASHLAGIAFDAHIWELFPYLCTGASVHIPDENARLDPRALGQWMDREQITHCFLPTPLAEAVLQSGPSWGRSLKVLLTGGDVLRSGPDESAPFRLYNHYGPSEVTVVSTSSPVAPGEESPAIGMAIGPVTTTVADSRGDPVPPGTVGELYLGGACLARGYLNNPRETALAFVPDPAAGPGARRYRSGDLVQVRADGQLRFVARTDAQVKIRGIRIEPVEIERRIAAHPDVEAVAVVKHESRDDCLSAYCVMREGTTTDGAFVADWSALYDATYSRSTEAVKGANFVGWLSSFDGRPIAASHMEEWASETTARIAALDPRRVYEVGVGTGILLHRLLPAVARYDGCDIAQQAITGIRNELGADAEGKVSLTRAAADAAPLGVNGPWDTVVMNSVSQYFPDEGYFASVLTHLADHLQADGHLFIGDVRDLTLARAFHAAVATAASKPGSTAAERRSAAETALARENELLAAPTFFLRWAQQRGGAMRALILPKCTQAPTEMTRFRYDVILTARDESLLHDAQVFHADAAGDGDAAQALIEEALQYPAIGASIEGIPLRLVHADVQAAEHLWSGIETNEPTQAGLSPAAVMHQFDAAGWRARIVANGQRSGCFAVQATRSDAWPELPTAVLTEAARCNTPARTTNRERTLSDLRAQLRQDLPEYMVPSHFIAVAALPLTSNGKVDRHALARQALPQRDTDAAALSPLERLIAGWWSEALNVPIVGPGDSFFDLGGHSLLAIQMVGKIATSTGIEIPVHMVLECPVLSDFARSLADWVGGETIVQQMLELLAAAPQESAVTEPA
ncbi:amino acid adenylation domain-containing protein [Tahibacter sp.]|uniref:amino acid adenylation domain-containing protein n=1 Tax=Tahibacter sp. TaxID=2056211 RepID=UPI0028C3E7F1|nr:amino acid adenylation domain-containing protein [Tahibacter sp.]